MPRDIPSLFDCEDLHKFAKTITQVMPYKGASMSRFYVCNFKGVSFLTKLHFYRKEPYELYGDTNSPAARKFMHQIEAEISILRLFRDEIVAQGYTWCILEMAYYKVCDNVRKAIPSRAKCNRAINNQAVSTDLERALCLHADKVRAGLSHDKCAFLVLDKCDMTLDDYLVRHVTTPVEISILKSILFLVIHCVYVISTLYPDFHHHDLHTDNVMLKVDRDFVFDPNNMKFIAMIIGGVQYHVPYFGIIPKLIDFGYSSLPSRRIVSDFVKNKLEMYYRTNNDLLVFFHWIYYAVNGAPQVDSILRQLEPTGSYVNYYQPHVRSIEKTLASYKDMVTNNLWQEYRDSAKGEIIVSFTPLPEVI